MQGPLVTTIRLHSFQAVKEQNYPPHAILWPTSMRGICFTTFNLYISRKSVYVQLFILVVLLYIIQACYVVRCTSSRQQNPRTGVSWSLWSWPGVPGPNLDKYATFEATVQTIKNRHGYFNLNLILILCWRCHTLVVKPVRNKLIYIIPTYIIYIYTLIN